MRETTQVRAMDDYFHSLLLDDALLRQVFKVDLSLSRAPAPGLPFLLPQQHRLTPAA